ncbi:hypothetical protein [Hyalangium rubrum]|uniref:Uncharacterized protein n=1 Tax=Hyalangium rubrum TaxID=3103134 RepID=A0ABU5H394_9BACT|nr:hypothetical protein [Hyalangium sp. s54d21]MDY7227929.1 hypothetical protein [Hyalangium sp. s54d21]
MSPSDSETALLLTKLGRVPNLLELAIREETQKGGDRYAIQQRLASEHRALKHPFLLATPMRHFDNCSTGEHLFPATDYELVIPLGKGLLFGTRERSAKFTEMILHETRQHGAPFPPKLADLFRMLP